MISSNRRPAYLYIFLLMILPIMDSLNGLINGGGNENGISLGIVYRIVLVVVGLVYWCVYGVDKEDITYLMILFTYLIISAVVYYNYYISTYTILLFKLLLPILVIVTLVSLYRVGKVDINILNRIMNFWTILFPLTLLLAYILGIGFSTYGNNSNLPGESVGFKGLYYAQNDISYVIDILYLYVVNKIVNQINLFNLIGFILVLFSSIIMGLKGNYLIIIAVTIFYLVRIEKDSSTKRRKFVLLIMIVTGIIAGLILFKDDINKIVERWQYFYSRNGFLSFITSTRSDRIAPTFEWLKDTLGFTGILIGSGYSYTDMIVPYKFVEMDFFDIFFQIGVIGVLLIYGYYLKLYLRNRKTQFYSGAFLLTLLISCLSGHILETALSGVFFGVICAGMIIGKSSNRSLIKKP
ncbi:hypothetical protein ACWNPI_00545 [Limosilactobacillus fermentum]